MNERGAGCEVLSSSHFAFHSRPLSVAAIRTNFNLFLFLFLLPGDRWQARCAFLLKISVCKVLIQVTIPE